ncbi:MAG: class I SAM-dependent methyltransferase family protein [Candidatus Aenigmarchaeota archaeon]|nr:class I SAM-dependent methyltransferase family protein [Candidatus Aenigmarchaeota archaeon]
MTLRKELHGLLSMKELSMVPSSFDILGNREKSVAIIDIPDSLKGKKLLIAEALMRKHKSVRSVLMRMSARKGVFRNREYELVAGDPDTEVMHVESGCRFLVDPQTCYFSQRESAERLRIAGKVKKGESIMVFFSGVGPFQVVIAKKSKARKVIGIELNDKAVYYARENARLNRLDSVETVFGDARHESARFHGKCDRVVMPLPESGVEYLQDAALCLKKKGVIHFYCFADEKSEGEMKERALKAVRSLGFGASVSESRKVLPYGPRIWKMRFDIEVKKR